MTKGGYMSALELSSLETAILIQLYESPAKNRKELSERLQAEPSLVNYAVKNLKEHDLIFRRGGSGWRLTDAGMVEAERAKAAAGNGGGIHIGRGGVSLGSRGLRIGLGIGIG
jgi:predicted transcriptional regulator